MQGSRQNSKNGRGHLPSIPQVPTHMVEWHMLYSDFVQRVEKQISARVPQNPRVPPVHSRNSVSSYCTQML